MCIKKSDVKVIIDHCDMPHCNFYGVVTEVESYRMLQHICMDCLEQMINRIQKGGNHAKAVVH
jgi:hypothetical protein